MVVPFDTRTLYGWYLLWFFQFNLGLSYALCYISVTSYFLCCGFYIIALCDDFKLSIKLIGATIELNQNEKNSQNYEENYRKIKKQMKKLVEIHVKIFEVFKLIENIFNGTIFSLLPINAIFVGLSMYEIEHVRLFIFQNL